MKEDIAKRWIAALRSGGYTQGKGGLCDKSHRMCCLGVLCDIIKDEVKIDWRLTAVGYSFGSYGGVPPNEVREYVGMVSTDGSYKSNGKQVNHLPGFNDHRGYSFKRIAKLIEQRWEKM